VRSAVAWLTEVFGFLERVRIGEDHRSQMQVGDDGAVIIADVRGEQQPPGAGVVTHVIKVRVADVDAQAGHRWQFTQTVRDVAPEEQGGETVRP
jgi:uncharacterized glyoxalase superfamily protein PhnB